ncbi:MAG: SRPBCC family protein [Proteobacteria bacterium]|nr:SRPBCC family protein [Pseudomonadota bacterium]
MMLTTESTIYIIYIATTPEKCWAALTGSEFSKQYFFGQLIEGGWRAGGRIRYRMPGGSEHIEGEILACEPPRLLRFTWRVVSMPAFRHLPDAIVSYRIEEGGEGVIRLTMLEEHPTPIDERLLTGGRSGWPAILSGLKSLLETGAAPRIAPPTPPQPMIDYMKEHGA